MVKNCAVIGCVHRSNRDKEFRFFKFPSMHTCGGGHVSLSRLERRERWISALHRDDITDLKLKYSYICSFHFVSGEPSSDPDHVDYVPSQNMGCPSVNRKKALKEPPTTAKHQYTQEIEFVNIGSDDEVKASDDLDHVDYVPSQNMGHPSEELQLARHSRLVDTKEVLKEPPATAKYQYTHEIEFISVSSDDEALNSSKSPLPPPKKKKLMKPDSKNRKTEEEDPLEAKMMEFISTNGSSDSLFGNLVAVKLGTIKEENRKKENKKRIMEILFN